MAFETTTQEKPTSIRQIARSVNDQFRQRAKEIAEGVGTALEVRENIQQSPAGRRIQAVTDSPLLEFAAPGVGGTGLLVNKGLMTAARLAKSPSFRIAKGGLRLEGGLQAPFLRAAIQQRVRRGTIPVIRGLPKVRVGSVPKGTPGVATRFGSATQAQARATALFQKLAEGRIKNTKELQRTLRALAEARSQTN
jgi:hypothetical protein